MTCPGRLPHCAFTLPALVLGTSWLVLTSGCEFGATTDSAGAPSTQRIPVIVREAAFDPAKVVLAEGVPAILEFTRVAESTCMNAVKMPWMEEAVDLPLNETVEIPIDPSKTGDFSYSCWMDMVHGEVAFVHSDDESTAQARGVESAARAPVHASAIVRASLATSIDPPAAPGSTALALAVERDRILGRDFILMTWIEPDANKQSRLRFARFTDQSWGATFTVARGVTASSEDPPSLTVVDTDTGRSTLLARAGNLAARSTDRGRIWVRIPAPDLEFASLAGGFEEVHAFGLSAASDESTMLWGAPAFAEQTVLDSRVSERSATSAASTSDGPVVVYWDRNEEDDRDIAIVRLEEMEWSEPRIIHADRWRATESPSHAPAVTAQSRNVVVAWYTEAKRRPRLLVTLSSDAGKTFGEPVEVDRPLGIRAPSGAVSVAIAPDGEAVVLWVATNQAGEADLLLSRVAADGRRGEELLLARMRATQLRSVPRMARAGEQLAVAWEEGGASAGVRAVTLPVDAIQPPTDADPTAVSAAGARIGEPAPPFVITSLSGDKVSLESLRGRPVLLNVWATWCLPCLEEIPELVELHDRHSAEDLAVVGVNVDMGSAVEDVRSFVAQHEIPYAIWLDPEERVRHAFGVRGLPATFVLDREGRMLLRLEGLVTAKDPELARALANARR